MLTGKLDIFNTKIINNETLVCIMVKWYNSSVFFINRINKAVIVMVFEKFLWFEFNKINRLGMRYPQDCATTHCTNQRIQLLKEKLNGSKNGDVNWPPRQIP